jgi:hypothetical protein
MKMTLKGLQTDDYLSLGLVIVFFIWNFIEGAIFENEYPTAMVDLYRVPIWRSMLVLLMVFAADWSAPVGIMLALTLFFYIMDLEVTSETWSLADLKRESK